MPEALSFVDHAGVEHRFDGSAGLQVEVGLAGRFQPPVAFTEDVVPFTDGSRLRQVRRTTREVVVPVEWTAATPMEMRTTLRDAARWLKPSNTGRLVAEAPDGGRRELKCHYAGGMELVEDQFTDSLQRAVLVFRAFDPYWLDSITDTRSFVIGTPAPFFPILPLRLTSSTVFADVNVDNSGDVETWPIWTVTGPGSDLVLSNLTTGEVLSSSVVLGIGETLVIDTSPELKTLRRGDGSNAYGTLSASSSLWSLVEGANSVRIEFSGATADSLVALSWRRRYFTP